MPEDPDWDAIAERFFAFYADRPQADIMRRYGVTSRAQISRWKAEGKRKPDGRTRKEKLPLKVLARMVELEGVTWDWIMAGIEPMRRRGASKAAPAASKPSAKKAARPPKPGGRKVAAKPALKPQLPRRKPPAG